MIRVYGNGKSIHDNLPLNRFRVGFCATVQFFGVHTVIRIGSNTLIGPQNWKYGDARNCTPLRLFLHIILCDTPAIGALQPYVSS